MDSAITVPPLEDVVEVLEKINVSKPSAKKTMHKNQINKKHHSGLNKKDNQFGGMKKGFLFQKTKKTTDLKSKNLKTSEDVSKVDELPLIKARNPNSGLVLKEVQDAMKEDCPTQPVDTNFLSKAESDPTVSRVLSDPVWLGILDEFQSDPVKAMEKYKDDKSVKDVMLSLCSKLGDSFLHMTSATKSEDELLSDRLMKDPKIRQALTDPFVETLMRCMKQGRNDRVREYLKEASPTQRNKVQLLVDHGLLAFQC